MTFRQLTLLYICSIISTSCGMGLKISKLTPGNSASPEVARAFITKWDTTKTGNLVGSNLSITLPIIDNCSYDFTVDWGDGSPVQTITSWDDPNKTHIYSSPGEKTIEMLGRIDCFSFNVDGDDLPDGDASKLIDVLQWGTNQWNNVAYMFFGADQLISFSATDAPDLSQNQTMRGMFRDCTRFDGQLNNWNTSQVQDMGEMFRGASSFNQPLRDWNTSQVQDMSYMFNGAALFNQYIGSWNTSQARVMISMFQGAVTFNQNIGEWDTSNVILMSSMFTNAAAFNQNISGWQTSNVTHMDHMFELATNFSLDLSLWNVSSVVDHSFFNLGNTLLIPPIF